MWAGGRTSDMTRQNAQRILMGPGRDWGTGAIPEDRIANVLMGRGISGAVDQVSIRHVSGLTSTLFFKSYDQGVDNWAGPPIDVIWLDEEPPAEIHSQALARTTATQGIVYLTFTPEWGMSEVVRLYYPEPTTDQRCYVRMDIEDALHIPAERRQEEIDKYPEHERDARVHGLPQLGSGAVYPIAESFIKTPAFEVPDHWAQIGGMDFGWDHPFGAVKLAWDRDADVVYVTACYKDRPATTKNTPIIHSATLLTWGAQLPWAWPHDGHVNDKMAAAPIASAYRAQRLRMLPEHATFPEGGYSTEAAIAQIFERMQGGRFKVFAHLSPWFEEFRTYHRKKGLIVKEHDDLMSATQKGFMMLRYARSMKPSFARMPAAIGLDYDPLSPGVMQ